ncbi:MAG: hypothetical protein HA494_04750 [Thaumarchaeota archaeon]|nr:hypothetical protein [Nitrososphaerota archaeon]
MVLEIRCGSCGACLYSGFELKSTRELLKAKNGVFKCRKCGAPLSVTDFTLEISKAH